VYVDATLGGGGHAEAILERIIPGGRLIGIDRDDDATAEASRRLQRFGEAAVIVRENFTAIKEVLHSLGLSQVDGILFDLGASSMQFENADRGFSFAAAGPLDMRMDRRQPVTAAEIVNRRPEEELAGLIWRYGEERWSRRIARAIVEARREQPIATTGRLATIVRRALPRRGHMRIDPATRTFQALRILVNRELEGLDRFIEVAIRRLQAGARFVVITFHSLEDRIVKHFLRQRARGCTCPPEFPVCVCGREPELRILTPKLLRPSAREVELNPRASSARLRAAVKS